MEMEPILKGEDRPSNQWWWGCEEEKLRVGGVCVMGSWLWECGEKNKQFSSKKKT